MVFRISANAKRNILEQYRIWKTHYPNLNIGNAIRKLYQDIQVKGLFFVSDTQLAIWVAKNYVVYRSKDAKWYFGGYYNKNKTVFTAQEALSCGRMADSAHNPSAIEHNNYHPRNQIEETKSQLYDFIQRVVRKVLYEEIQRNSSLW